jgi:hypothetical protein
MHLELVQPFHMDLLDGMAKIAGECLEYDTPGGVPYSSKRPRYTRTSCCDWRRFATRDLCVRCRSLLRHDGLLIEMCCAGRGQQLVEPHNGLHIHVTEAASAKPAVQRQACVPRVAPPQDDRQAVKCIARDAQLRTQCSPVPFHRRQQAPAARQLAP